MYRPVIPTRNTAHFHRRRRRRTIGPIVAYGKSLALGFAVLEAVPSARVDPEPRHDIPGASVIGRRSASEPTSTAQHMAPLLAAPHPSTLAPGCGTSPPAAPPASLASGDRRRKLCARPWAAGGPDGRPAPDQRPPRWPSRPAGMGSSRRAPDPRNTPRPPCEAARSSRYTFAGPPPGNLPTSPRGRDSDPGWLGTRSSSRLRSDRVAPAMARASSRRTAAGVRRCVRSTGSPVPRLLRETASVPSSCRSTTYAHGPAPSLRVPRTGCSFPSLANEMLASPAPSTATVSDEWPSLSKTSRPTSSSPSGPRPTTPRLARRRPSPSKISTRSARTTPRFCVPLLRVIAASHVIEMRGRPESAGSRPGRIGVRQPSSKCDGHIAAIRRATRGA
jgi:hypothetical protein